MRKPLTVINVTFSVVCTLKGMSRWSIELIKAMLLCILFVDTVNTKIKEHNALNFMLCQDCQYTGVCGSYTTPYTEYDEVWKLCIKWPLAPAKREGYLYLKSLLSWGFSCSPVSPRRQLCWLSWTCQLQGWLQARHTTNPQFLKLRGTSATR